MSNLSVILGQNTAKIKTKDKETGKELEFTVSPLTLGDIAKAEEKFGCDLEGFEKAAKKVGNLLYLIYLSIQRRHKDVIFEDIADMFTVADMTELTQILQTILSLSGMAAEKNEERATPVTAA